MTDTIKSYAVDSNRVVYPVTVPYIEREHIHVYVGTDPKVQLDYTWVTDTSIQLSAGTDKVVTVRRITVPEVLDFKNNAWMQESVLDRAFNITGYQAEEAKDVADLLDPQAVAQEVAALSTDIAIQAAEIAVADAIAPAVQARDDAQAQVTLAAAEVTKAAAEVAKASAHVTSAQQAKEGAETALGGITNQLDLAKAEVTKAEGEVAKAVAETAKCVAETTKCVAETAKCVSARDVANQHVASANQHRTDAYSYQEQAGTYAGASASSASDAAGEVTKAAAEVTKAEAEVTKAAQHAAAAANSAAAADVTKQSEVIDVSTHQVSTGTATGQIKVVRVGDAVTVTGDILFSSAIDVVSFDDLLQPIIPAWARPFVNVYGKGRHRTLGEQVELQLMVSTSGWLTFEFYNYQSGLAHNATDTHGFTITYALA